MSSSLHLQAFGKQISEAIFSYFDSGAPFVLLWIGGERHYLCEQNGMISSDREMILHQMARYVADLEANNLWKKHLADSSSRAPNQAQISGFYYRSARDSQPN